MNVCIAGRLHGAAFAVVTPATLGVSLNPNPARPTRGDEGLADGFKVCIMQT